MLSLHCCGRRLIAGGPQLLATYQVQPELFQVAKGGPNNSLTATYQVPAVAPAAETMVGHIHTALQGNLHLPSSLNTSNTPGPLRIWLQHKLLYCWLTGSA